MDIDELRTTDYGLWIESQAKLLEQGKFDKLDVKRVADQLRLGAVSWQLALIGHATDILECKLGLLLTPQYNEQRQWSRAILRSQAQVQQLLASSPSLAKTMTSDTLATCYEAGRNIFLAAYPDAAPPERCPFTWTDIFWS